MYVIGENYVSAENRTVLIKDLKIGDKIWTYNESSKQNELRKIIKIKQADNCFVPNNETYRIVFTNLKVLLCNSKNLLGVGQDNTKFILADELKSGEMIRRINHPIDIWKIEKDMPLNYSHYILEIENSDNCYLGEVLVSDIPH
jgi:hypothetical protein